MFTFMNALSFWRYAIGSLFRGGVILRINGRFVLIEVFKDGNCYMALAATPDCVVTDCYGTTKQLAIKMALMRLNQTLKMDVKEEELDDFVEKDGFYKIIKRLQILVFFGAIAVSGLFTGTSSAKADEVTIGYCDMTIQQGVHTPSNRAQATGPCKDYESGYYIEANGQKYFVIDGLMFNVVDYDGQQFEMATPQYPKLLLTVHIVKKGESQSGTKKGWVKENNQWFYYNSQGKKQIGWLRDGSNWYFLDTKGIMRTGWIYDNAWYYLTGSGAMKTGWLLDKSKWYYLASSGAMKTGWLLDKSKWYYLYSNGVMASNTNIGNYYLDRNGAWIK